MDKKPLGDDLASPPRPLPLMCTSMLGPLSVYTWMASQPQELVNLRSKRLPPPAPPHPPRVPISSYLQSKSSLPTCSLSTKKHTVFEEPTQNKLLTIALAIVREWSPCKFPGNSLGSRLLPQLL